eukprot:6970874-Karenia_brevis.AAC.1
MFKVAETANACGSTISADARSSVGRGSVHQPSPHWQQPNTVGMANNVSWPEHMNDRAVLGLHFCLLEHASSCLVS